MTASPATCDLTDAHPDLWVLDAIWRDYGGNTAFHGSAVTLKLFEDNTWVGRTLEDPGEGRVLVVDGGGSLRCALLGDRLAALAVKNNWSGLVVYGCVRDSAQLRSMPLGVKALNVHPRKTEKRGTGERDIPVRFAGVTITPGAWVYADADGIVVAERSLG